MTTDRRVVAVCGLLAAANIASLVLNASVPCQPVATTESRCVESAPARTAVTEDGFRVFSETKCRRTGRTVACDFWVRNTRANRLFTVVGGSQTVLVDDTGRPHPAVRAQLFNRTGWNAPAAASAPPRLELMIPSGATAPLTVEFDDVDASVRSIAIAAEWSAAPGTETAHRSGDFIARF